MSGRTFLMSPADRVLQGAGAVGGLPALLDEWGTSRAFLVTGRSVSGGDAYRALVERLGEAVAGSFAGIQAHNPSRRVLELIGAARSARADVIVAIGGGSPIDAAKLAALGVAESLGDAEALRRYVPSPGWTPPRVDALPVVAIPTTLSAAEWNGIGAFVDEDVHAKLLVNLRELTPRAVVLDPEVCRETPRELWATTGARAIDHAVETIYSTTAHPYPTSLALGALSMLARALPASSADARNLDAALDCQVAAWLSVAASFNVITGLSHAIGHQLGALGLPHGATSCIMLPPVMRFLEPATRAEQTRMASALGDAGRPAADLVEALFDRLEVRRRVSDYDLGRDRIADVADATMTQGRAIVDAAPRDVSREDVVRLLEEAW